MPAPPITPAPPSPFSSLTLEPIGVIHTPHGDRASAPRQPYAADSVPGTIELFPGRGFEHALHDLAGWEYIWVIFWFHLNKGWRPKVLPPRSKVRRGLFSTRTPHRPNPLGLSVLQLVSVDRLTLNVRGVDLIDGTPILDIKPYVPWADAIPNAGTGWFTPPGDLATDDMAPIAAPNAPRPSDPVAPWGVTFDAHCAAQLAYLRDSHGVDLAAGLRRALALGPHPHPYRRIKPDGADAFVVAHKAWRARFRALGDGRTLEVFEIFSGYRVTSLDDPDDPAPDLPMHRAFVARWSPRHAPR